MIILRHINTAWSAFPSIISVLITVPVLCCLSANSSFVACYIFWNICQTLLACCRVPSTVQNRLPVGTDQKCSAVQLNPWMGGEGISSDPWACWHEHKALTCSPSRQGKIVSKVPAWMRLLPKQTRKMRAIHFHSGFRQQKYIGTESNRTHEHRASEQHTCKLVPHARAAGSIYPYAVGICLAAWLKPLALPSSEIPRNSGLKVILFYLGKFSR